MLQDFLAALALMLVLEGILPLVAPGFWRDTFTRITRFTDGQLRFVGLTSLLLGCVLFILFK
ncbi:MAG: DUF2065 domain-containing protein [Candidatus Dactylopiibacterium carminicum]|uniref:DUF2065 domain-containing protein n=1 Tax=Candidatus Dactylopiibacterium carminicum TaxID=857335 RepID=A0A272EZ37_9RHOO|nr:DUF2065 domain-containing protein [Candidatus Dactylopiibacterium carminicum]KAF7600880.1 DUF2065 domain-containing protein [Candidatus Dactylopiibacterium carminicum]PAS95379.1 MAG: DUF2065 domain-containing protein [Candidatus Dactylopiibacterium carminicum]PAS98610.1 MAG: DUF2065 domain-containing protein [Candidatus Dactylopiibacterium carminicum]PAT00879.1 MAG: DUF2065 domain-containing protein [Candidatus Dactylopiibacterium carminicum]